MGRSTRATPPWGSSRQPAGELRCLLVIAEADQPEPRQPGRVDPGRAAPIRRAGRIRDTRGENVGSSAATEGGGSGSQNRLGSSRCSSISRRPMSSGRSGSASGASAVQVSGGGSDRAGRASGQNSPLSSSYIRSTIWASATGGRAPSAKGHAGRWSRPRSTRGRRRPRSAPRRSRGAVALHQRDEAESAMRAMSPDQVELR